MMSKRIVCLALCLSLLMTVFPSFTPALASGVSDVMCVYNCKEWVSLRELPDTASKRLEKVRLGELVTDCHEEYNDFIYCEFNGKSGYIQAKYLKTTPYSSGESFPGNQMVVNVSDWASMWESASTSSKRVVRVPVGSIVTACVGTVGGFILCEYTSGKKVYKGYISTTYLKKANYTVHTQNASVIAKAGGDGEGITMTVVNCESWVTLREKQSDSSARLARVPLGTSVNRCVRVSDDFYYCEYKGIYGYIQSQYLSANGYTPSYYNYTPVPYVPVVTAAPADTGDTVNTFTTLPMLPTRAALEAIGVSTLAETRQGYTIVVQKVFNDYEEMLAVCYNQNQVPLWRVYERSQAELSDVGQLDAFVGGTAEDPQLIVYVNGDGFMSYSFGPTLRRRWYLSAAGLEINDSIFTMAADDGTFYIAVSDVLMHISTDGQLLWRTKLNDSSIFWPISIEVDTSGVTVLYDNAFEEENAYNEVHFSLDGTMLYKTQRENDAEG